MIPNQKESIESIKEKKKLAYGSIPLPKLWAPGSMLSGAASGSRKLSRKAAG
jgi:hypothetical protein